MFYMATTQNITFLERYENQLNEGFLKHDEDQKLLVNRLQTINESIQSYLEQKSSSQIKKIFSFKSDEPQKITKGIYLWGDVGRGKTYLLDMFYENLSSDKKLRVHFHRFMQLIHESLEKLTDSKNSLSTVAKDLANQYIIICLDEIFVADITDAMLLGELFKNLINNGVVLLFTSNLPPNDLYKDGLQRARFLPAITLIENSCHIIELGGHKDYRLETLEHNRLYQLTTTANCNENLESLFKMMSGALQSQYDKKKLQINHRQLPIKKYSPGLAWFDFDILCNTYRDSSDYIQLATYFTTIIISDVYIMNADQDDVARRFINMIDVMYDRHINIIISAQSIPEQLYIGTRLKNEFKRTISRLKEMQTIDYLTKNKEYKEILDRKMSEIDLNFVETSLDLNNPTRFGDWVNNNGRCSDF